MHPCNYKRFHCFSQIHSINYHHSSTGRIVQEREISQRKQISLKLKLMALSLEAKRLQSRESKPGIYKFDWKICQVMCKYDREIGQIVCNHYACAVLAILGLVL